jgi:hypothetical protein
MYALEERAHHPPQPPPLSMERLPPSSSYPTPGSAGAMVSAGGIPASHHLAPLSTVHEGRIWSLQVVQQPIRARMCGFGDKVSLCVFTPYLVPVNLFTLFLNVFV